MTDLQIKETAKHLTAEEIEHLLRTCYFSFDAKAREYAEYLQRTHSCSTEGE